MRDECPYGAFGLHAFNETIVSNDRDHVEICVQCGDKAMYNVINGRVDSVKYRKDHERDFIQPSDPRFVRLYGSDGVKLLEEQVERKIKAKVTQEAMIPEARDYLRTLKRSSVLFSK